MLCFPVYPQSFYLAAALAMRIEMHYHIRWSNSELDWERFSTSQEAEQAARQLVRPGETFTLEQVDEKNCMHCPEVCKRALVNNKGGDAKFI
jgi:hypothetical protein